MVKFTNKIEAIKALREMPKLTISGAVPNTDSPGVINGATSISPYIGLKEAKDFVEAVMEFAAEMSKKVCFSCKREIKMEGEVTYCPHCAVVRPLLVR